VEWIRSSKSTPPWSANVAMTASSTVPRSSASTASTRSAILTMRSMPGCRRAVVGKENVPRSITVEQADRDGLGKLVKELLACLEGFVGRHLFGDIDHVGHDITVIRVIESIVVGDLKPHPSPVEVFVAQSHPASRARSGQHVDPVGYGRVAVVRMDDLKSPPTDELIIGHPSISVRAGSTAT